MTPPKPVFDQEVKCGAAHTLGVCNPSPPPEDLVKRIKDYPPPRDYMDQTRDSTTRRDKYTCEVEIIGNRGRNAEIGTPPR